MASLQTPPLRVSRTVSACAQCRSAKTKCDGKLPSCTHCERVGKAAECTSANDEYARGKERSYVASLEARIERLEAECHRYRRHQPPRAPSPYQTTESPQPHLIYKQTEESDVADLVSDFGYLAVNSTASGYQGFVQEMSFARLLFSTAAVNDLPRASLGAFPPRELAVGLVDECLRKVLVYCPILTSSAIYGTLESVYQHDGRYCTPLGRWNLRFVLAIGSLCRSTAKGDVQYQTAVSHAASAAEFRELVVQPGSIASLQSILLLVLYALLDPSHFSPWYTIGVAARVMVDIGLHQDPPEEANLRPSQLELRRRIFFCLYNLDRIVTMSYARTPSFTDSSVEVQMPSPNMSFLSFHTENFIAPVNTDLWVELLKIHRIQSSAYQSVFLVTRDELYKPWIDRVMLMNQVRADCERVKQSLTSEIAHIVDAEINYFELLMLQPTGRNQPLDPYGEILVFQAATEFVTHTAFICDPSWAHSSATVLDLERIMRVSQWLLDVLADNTSPVLVTETPQQPQLPQGVVAPSIISYSPIERRQSAIYTLTRLDMIVEQLSIRFHPPDTDKAYVLHAIPSTRQPGARQKFDYHDFKQQCQQTLERLCNWL